MFEHAHSHHFHLFRNREIDSLYIMNALKMFATGLVSIFIPIYFYKLGIPIWAIISFWFIRAVFRVVFTYLSLPLIRRLSDKMMMFIGIPFLITYFLLLNQIQGLGILFFVTPIAISFYAIFFWSGYHVDFSSSTNFDSNEEAEISTNYIIMDVVRFITPLIGGIIIINSGFHLIFIIASIVLIISVIPLLFFPKRSFSKKINAKSINKALKDKYFLNFRKAIYGHVTNEMITENIWPIFLFLIIGNIEVLGFHMSIGLFIGAIGTYVANKLSDKNKNHKLFNIASVMQSLIWFTRSVVRSFNMVLGVHFIGYFFHDSIVFLFSSRYYKFLKNVENPSVYVIAYDMFNGIARICIFPIFILLAFFLTESLFFTVSFILTGIALSFIRFAGR